MTEIPKSMGEPAATDPPIVLFDGVCNFCNDTVNFLIDHEPGASFRFAALQSEAGRSLLRRHRLPEHEIDTLILIENGVAHTRSSAAVRIAAHLRPPWRWLSWLRIVPRFLRDRGYDFFAARRYRWFGRREQCRLPEPGLRERFLGSGLES